MKPEAEVLWKYLFNGGQISTERFETAFKVYQNMEDILFQMRQELMAKLVGRLQEALPSYTFEDTGLVKGIQWRPGCFYRPEWVIADENQEPNQPRALLAFALELDRKDFSALYFGVIKHSKRLPYAGHTPPAGSIYHEIGEKVKGLADWKTSDTWVCYAASTDPLHRLGWKLGEPEVNLRLASSDGQQEFVHFYLERFGRLREMLEEVISRAMSQEKEKLG